MWIEIDLILQTETKTKHTHWRELINSTYILSISPIFSDHPSVEITTMGLGRVIKTYTDECTHAIYNSFLIALQGSPVDLDEWGYIKPLLNEQVEAIHRHMLYQETIASLANCEGLR